MLNPSADAKRLNDQPRHRMYRSTWLRTSGSRAVRITFYRPRATIFSRRHSLAKELDDSDPKRGHRVGSASSEFEHRDCGKHLHVTSQVCDHDQLSFEEKAPAEGA